MKTILFLPHRLPFPPNKGDKIRSFHILKALSRHYRVMLGTFVDDPADWAFRDEVSALVEDAFFCPLSPRFAKLRSALGLLDGRPLSLPYYRDSRMARWVSQVLARGRIDGVFVFSSVMAQYVDRDDVVVDFCDVDSEKWRSYADKQRGPMAWVYAREADRLLAYERQIAARCRRALFVSDNEAALFRRLAPEVCDRIEVMANGVDADYFSPDSGYEDPFPPGAEPVVFTGAMSYWPNVDAMRWFCAEVLPEVRARRPNFRLYIVGAQPTRAVLALASDPDVVVTGTVPDVRPYLAHARAVVAPLRIARGVQNKVLEAMAMARPVIVSPEAMCGLAGGSPEQLRVAEDAAAWVKLLSSLDSLPCEAPENRCFIEARYDWSSNLAALNSLWN